jgi:hypothetical protein
MDAFGVSEASAVRDLKKFEREHPGAMRYDITDKQYVPRRGGHSTQRRMDDPKIKRALALLASAGHPMGWRG